MRIVRRLTHVLILVLTLVSARRRRRSSSRRPPGSRTGCAATSCAQANQYLNGTLSIERLGGNLFFGIEMENIGVSMDGSQVVAVKDLGLDYNVFQLITKGLSVDNIRLDQAGDLPASRRRHLVAQPAGQEAGNRSRSPRARGSDRDRHASASATDRWSSSRRSGRRGVEVPKRFDHLDAKLSFKYEPVRYSIEITHVSFRGSDPALAVNALSGGDRRQRRHRVRREAGAADGGNVAVGRRRGAAVPVDAGSSTSRSPRTSCRCRRLRALVPALAGVRLQPAFDVKVDGPLDRLGVEMNVRSSPAS